jgi:hypothetical protein
VAADRPAARAPRSVRAPAVLIGCGFALVVVIVLVIGGVVLVNSGPFRQAFCNSWNNNPQDSQTPCPLQPSQ